MENQKINIGVNFSPLVESVKTAKVGDKIVLKLISGLTPNGIIWRSNDSDVPTLDDSTVIFNEPGIYIPVILGHIQHISYGITITN